MKQYDIEERLQWAVIDELPKGQDALRPIWKTIEEHARGVPMSTAYRKVFERTGGGIVPGKPDDDALIIARELKAFDVRMGLSVRAVAKSILGALVNIDPLCVEVAMAVAPNLAALMLMCATLRKRPVLDLRFPRPKGTRRRNGVTLVLREDADGDLIESTPGKWRNEYVGNPRCPTDWCDPHPEVLAEQRAEYTLWWTALARLADRLNALPPSRGLRGFTVTRPECHARPWEVPGARSPRVLRPLCEAPQPSSTVPKMSKKHRFNRKNVHGSLFHST